MPAVQSSANSAQSLTGKPSRVIYSSCLFLSNITKITILKTPEGNKSFRQLLDITSHNLLGEPNSVFHSPGRRSRGPDFWTSRKGSVPSESTDANSSGAFWIHRSRCTALAPSLKQRKHTEALRK